jgi:iron complex outermembrane receptor protein
MIDQTTYPQFMRIKMALMFSACFLSGQLVAAVESIETVEVYGRNTKGLNLDTVNSAANRLGLSAMDLPASMEMLSNYEIMIRGDFSAMSALTRATGFTSSANPGNGGTSVAVRGFSGHSSIAYTYDGTRLYVGSGTVTFPADTWTVERVEILRGAGSVINGVGAIGATVNYVPKAPKFEDINSEIDLTTGSDNLSRIAFGSGGKLTDELAYRVDMVNHDSDGYVDNGDEARRALAAALLYRPSDVLDVKFSIDYAETDQSAYWGTPLVNGEIVNSTRDNNYNVDDGLVEYEDIWPRVHINWKINDAMTFRNDTHYLKADRHWRNVESYDHNGATEQVDRSFYLEILHEQEQWGNRSDLLFDFSLAGMQSNLSIGAEVNAIYFTHFNNRPYSGSSSVDLLNPVAGRWSDSVQSQTSKDFESETFQYAVFVDYQIELTEQLSLVTGIRQDRIEFDREDFARSNETDHSEAAAKIDSDLSATSWRIGAVYQPSETTSIYAQVSDAQDSIQSILSATNVDLKLGEGRQYEVGIKQSFWDERVQYTLAIYDIEKENLLSQDPGGVEFQIGQQSSQGVELDVSVQALENLTVDFNVALTDPEFDEFVKNSADLSGNTPMNVSRKAANLWLYWNATDKWLVNGGMRYVGERYTNDTNTTKLVSYVSFDAGLQWLVDDSLSISLRGKNLTDEEDFVLSPYGNQWLLAQGRSYEVGLNYAF